MKQDTKRQLLMVDKEASAAREKAYRDYVMHMRWRLQSNRVKRGEKR